MFKDHISNVLDSMINLLMVVNPEGKITNVNKAACRLLEYRHEELIGLSVEKIIPDQVFQAGNIQELLKEGTLSDRLSTYRTKQGKLLNMRLSGLVMRDSQDRPAGLVIIAENVTRQIDADEQLRKLSRAVEQSACSIVITDRKGRIEYVNPRFLKSSGYSEDEVLGKSHRILKSDAHSKEFYRELWNTISTGREWRGEILNRKKSGELYWQSVSISSITNQQGDITHYVAVKEDITRRKKAEQEREKTLERRKRLNQLWSALFTSECLTCKLKAITQGGVDIFGADFCRIWMIKPGDLCESGCVHAETVEEKHKCRYRNLCLFLVASSGRYTHINGKTHRRVPFDCYKIGRVAAGKRDKFLTNDVVNDREIHDHQWARRLGLVSFAGYRLLSTTGKPLGVLALFSKQPISSEEDSLLEGLANTTSQIIIMGQTEEALRESEERNRLVVDSAMDAVITIDLKGIITGWNPRASEMFGWPSGEIMGKSLSDTIIPPQYRPAHIQGLKEFRKTGKGLVIDHRMDITALHLDGHEFPIELSISTPKKMKGVLTFTAFIHDITPRKQVESELLKAKESAEAASQAKSEFLANMSHEIRTPMNAIIGMTDLALDTELTGEQREYLTLARSSAESLLNLLNDILDFSKIEAGKLDLESTDFDLHDCLYDILNLLALRAYKKGLELVCHLPPEVPYRLIGDPGRLRQIIVNLVGNAIKFTDRGEVVIKVTREFATDEKICLQFAISDTGIGVPLDKQALIFDAFTQLDGSTTRKHGGTGLGLSISAKLVNLMEGRIWLDSREGKGSRFFFTAFFGLQKKRPAALSTDQSLKGIPVLTLVGNAANREFLQESLSYWRMKPVSAENGPQALSLIKTAQREGQPFSLMIIDFDLWGMDGVTFTDNINKARKVTDLGVIALFSSGRSKDTINDSLETFDCLTKPVSTKELWKSLITALKASQPGEAGAPVDADDRSRMAFGPELNILLAEDDPVNQLLTTRILEKQGYRVGVAENGWEVLELLSKRSIDFDLVLMDVQMPLMDGFEVTRAIRDQGNKIPIIAVTAYAMKGDRQKCLDVGMDGYLAKPLKPLELIEAIEDLRPDLSQPVSTAFEEKSLKEVIDREELIKSVENDMELLSDMVKIFFRNNPSQLSEIKKAIEKKDCRTLTFSAHSLKGSLGNFAAKAAHEAAARLEKMGYDQDLGEADQALEALEGEVKLLKTALGAFRKKG